MASILVSCFVYFISRYHGDPHAWADFRTALLACGMVLAVFAIYHLVRTPWLVHKDASADAKPIGKLYGVVGGLVVLSLIAGVVASTIFVVRITEKDETPQSAKVDTSSSQSSNQSTSTTNDPSPHSAPVENKSAAPITTTERNRLNRRVPQLIREFQLKFPNSARDVNEATLWVNAQLKREGERGEIVIDGLPTVQKSQTTINFPQAFSFRDCNDCSAQIGNIQYNVNGQPIPVQPTQIAPAKPPQ
jgi:uncharacterized protein YpmS